MSTTESTAPVITNAGTMPTTSRKLFVNLPVTDLQRSITFFEALGFVFNPQFTDASATCMLVGTDAYFMLLVKDRFDSFSRRPRGDAKAETNLLLAISADSRAEVDELFAKAIAGGGSPATEPQDHGFMYSQTFYDLDGYHWELFWMDSSAVNG